MKNLILGILCILTIPLSGQNFKIILKKAPCNQDGILLMEGLDPQLHASVTWFSRAGSEQHVVIGNTDQFSSYGGGNCWATIAGVNGNLWNVHFDSDLPFKVSFDIQTGICPNPHIVTANIQGGTAPFYYKWLHQQSVVSTSNPLMVVGGGEYELEVTDSKGCVYHSIDSLAVYLENLSNITYDVLTTPANCTNGTAEVVNVQGGIAPFGYEWFNGATTPKINSLSQGYYDVAVIDAQGCKSKTSFNLSQSVSLKINAVEKHASCNNNDGSIEAFTSGGKPPYAYTWNNGEKTSKIDNLSQGLYQVEVVDANQCQNSSYFYLQSISPINVLIQNVVASSCSGPTGSAELQVQGGTPPYAFVWNTLPVQTISKLANVSGGNYQFTVTDAKQCIRTGNVNIPFDKVPNIELYSYPDTCGDFTGKIESQISGGTEPFIYTWSNGETTKDVQNLSAGTYTLMIEDANKCISSKSTTVNNISPIKIILIPTPSSCIYSNDGELEASVWGGVPPYEYAWSNGANTPGIVNLREGYYTLRVTDAQGCIVTEGYKLGYNHNTDYCYCTLKGKVYFDANENCMQDPGDYLIPNIPIHLSKIGTYFSNQDGEYSIKIPTGKYALSELTHEVYPLASCQVDIVQIEATAESGCTIINDFAHSKNPLRDIHISIWPDFFAIPGFPFYQELFISNDGTVDESDMAVQVIHDAHLELPQFHPVGIFSPSALPYTYETTSIGTMKPSQQIKMDIVNNVPANVPLGIQLWFEAEGAVEPPAGNWRNDNTPWNNKHTYSVLTAGSYDPNFIQVQPQGRDELGYISKNQKSLEYRVHFQNEGNYYTRFVDVMVHLDKNLDFNTVKPIYASHPGILFVSENGNIHYRFDPIKLFPQGWDESLSKGYFIFSINLREGLPEGTPIRTSAEIFFDYNQPVATNIARNTIELIQSNKQLNDDHSNLSVFPNPNKGSFSFPIESKLQTISTLELLNILGIVVFQKKIQIMEGSQIITIDSEIENSGIYYLKLCDDGGHCSTSKFQILK